MKNIHVLRTDKPSRLIIYSTLLNEFRLLDEPIEDWKHKKNIYITNSEEIKDGDWCLGIDSDNVKYLVKINPTDNVRYHTQIFKIILTTDQDLIKDGVQAIDDEFLQWFVNNPSCEEIEIEQTFVTNSGLGYQEYAVLDSNFKVIEINTKIPQTSYYLGKTTILNTYEYVINYKIIIPKEEPKQDYNGVHFTHCYQGEYEDGCKYGENNCPAKPLKNFKLQCKDCKDNLTDCTCMEDTINMKQETLINDTDSYFWGFENFEVIKTEEDAKIFVETLKKIPEPNEKLKKAFKNYNKQETLEEAIGNWIDANCDRQDGLETLSDAIKFGVNWREVQDKNKYSEEEIIDLLLARDIELNSFGGIDKAKEWFEQFKKK